MKRHILGYICIFRETDRWSERRVQSNIFWDIYLERQTDRVRGGCEATYSGIYIFRETDRWSERRVRSDIFREIYI